MYGSCQAQGNAFSRRRTSVSMLASAQSPSFLTVPSVAFVLSQTQSRVAPAVIVRRWRKFKN